MEFFHACFDASGIETAKLAIVFHICKYYQRFSLLRVLFALP
jgi:hypothetical protein